MSLAFEMHWKRFGGAGPLSWSGYAGRISIRFDLVCFSEIAIRSGNACTPQSWGTAMRLLWDKKVDLLPLVARSCHWITGNRPSSRR